MTTETHTIPAPVVSVVVACRNEAGSIRAFMESMLKAAAGGPECEFLIADGKSSDGTGEAVLEFAAAHAAVRLIDNPERIVSTGLNRAVREARGEIIIRMDAHTEYAPGYVAECVRILEETGADNVGGPARTRATGLLGEAIAAAYHSPFTCGGAKFHQEDYEGYVDTVTYGCWRRQKLLDLGLFDPDLARNQDDELNLRVVRAGGRIWQSPSIVSWYSPRSSLSGLVKQYFQYGFWKVAVIRKHRLPASWRHLVPAMFVTFLLLGPLLGVVLLLVDSAPARGVLRIWIAGLIVYLLACFTAAVFAAARRGPRLLGLLPGVIAAYHVAYGSGFLWGLGYWMARRDGPGGKDNALTALTR